MKESNSYYLKDWYRYDNLITTIEFLSSEDIIIPQKIVNDKKISNNARLIVLAILSLAKDNKRISVKKIINLLNITEPTYLKARRELEKNDYLYIEKRKFYILSDNITERSKMSKKFDRPYPKIKKERDQ